MEDQSKRTVKELLTALLLSNRRHARYVRVLACLAVAVAVVVPLAIRQHGITMTTQQTVLDCQYAGSGAHTHNADCYDADGNLVCPLPERPFHTHTASCYATERVLACGQEESAGHAHTDACYDEEGNLTCGQAETPGHTHTDACYETRTTDRLTCGMEETADEHVHSSSCFKTITVEEPDPEPAATNDGDSASNTSDPKAKSDGKPAEEPNPEQEFSGVLKAKDESGNEHVVLVVAVKAPKGALPKGSTMRVEHVNLNKKDESGLTTQDKLDNALRKEAGEDAAFVQEDAVDITFYDAQGNRVDPAKKVEVRITTSMVRTFSDQRTAGDEAVIDNGILVMHVVDKQHTKRADAPDAEVLRNVGLVNQNKDDRSTGHEDTVLFETDEFSPFVVARVNNAALASDVEPVVVDQEEDATVEDAEETPEDQSENADRPAQAFTHRFADTDGNQLMRVDVLAPEGAFPLGTTMQVTWVDVSHIEDAVSMAVAERTDGKLVDMRAVDITFIDPDGHEIEPAEKITVTFVSDFIDTQDESFVVHVDDEGKAEVVDSLGTKELEKREMADQADELVFESDAFSTYVVALTTLHKEMTAGDGTTYDITVDAPAEAGIPQDAELRVSEITEGDEGYDEYLAQAAETAGLNSAEEASYARFFDIQIWSGDQKIEPSSDVQVSIKLMDTTGEGADLRVVHFGADGPEMMELLAEEGGDQATAELNFTTDEFSVYTVIKPRSASELNTLLNSGKSYALVTGIAGDPGATTGYNESWSQDYLTIIVNAQAMTDTAGVKVNGYSGREGLGAVGVHAWTDSDGTNYVGGIATQWGFESAGNGTYRIFAVKNGNKQYIRRNGNNNVALTNNANNATRFTITLNQDGTVLIHEGNSYLHNFVEYGNEWSARNYTFDSSNSRPTGEDYKFRLCELSDDFEPKAAQKVAASTITTNANYVIYRKFVDEHDNEELYALAHDGSFVRVYDGGDTVYWRETDKNIYWNYQMLDSYPVLFTQDPITHETIYINPKHSAGQTLTPEPGGLTLLGKDNGEYGTTIECWDQEEYDYSGLHVTVDGEGNASLSTGTRIGNTSDEFLFALESQMPGGTKEEVATVDSDTLGIKITMFDYGNPNTEYSAGTKLTEMTNIVGNADYTPHAAHDLVRPYLVNDLPANKNGNAMTGLFSSGGAITYSQSGVNHLFLQSYYDESGTFRYRSEDNYAYLGRNGQTDFKVYRQVATPYTKSTNNAYEVQVGHSYYYHGHFMPFNDIDMNNNLSRLMNQYGNDYQNGHAAGEISVDDGRSYEEVYGVQGIPNYYTGMKMEATFIQPKNGKLDNGDDMVFKFTGDDDMWVYIDGVLVLDVGGIHEPLSGTIDFASGKVFNPAGSSLAGERTLYQIFQSVRTASGTPQAVKDKIASIEWKDVDGDGTPDTFADYSTHSFSAFYMERGAGASNLDLQFNLKVVLTDQFVVEKKVPEGVDGRFDNHEYRFRATYKVGNNEYPLHAGIDGVCTTVVYRDRKDGQGNPVPVQVDNDGYFTLRAGEAAIFKMVDNMIQYDVKEVDIDGNVIDRVEINGQDATVTGGVADAGYSYVDSRPQVIVTNHPKTQNLKITKFITEDSAPIEEGENPVFEFRVYLESTIVGADGTTTEHKLVPYSYGPYYLTKEIDEVLYYYKLTGENNTPVQQGTTPVVCSTTGRSGSINSIPPEYTIIIPDLPVGTNFYIEERRDNIPVGYAFVREDLQPDTYDHTDLYSGDDPSQEVINRIIARDETDHQVFDPDTIGMIKNGVDAESHVYNRKKYTVLDISLLKVDADTIGEGQTPTLLAGATFYLTKMDDQDHESAYVPTVVARVEEEGPVEVEETGNHNFTVPEHGVEITGLTAGTYVLHEVSAPDGYNVTEGSWTFTVDLDSVQITDVKKADGTVVDDIASGLTLTIPNPPGAQLPEAGGPGTYLYTLCGLALFAAAGFVGLASRRKARKEVA